MKEVPGEGLLILWFIKRRNTLETMRSSLSQVEILLGEHQLHSENKSNRQGLIFRIIMMIMEIAYLFDNYFCAQTSYTLYM